MGSGVEFRRADREALWEAGPCVAFRGLRYSTWYSLRPSSCAMKTRLLVNKVGNDREGKAWRERLAQAAIPVFKTVIGDRVAYSRVPEMAYVKDRKARGEVESWFREVVEWAATEVEVF